MSSRSFPKTLKVRVPSTNPINGKNVYEVVDPKVLQPAQTFSRFKFKIKNIAKRVLNRGVITPPLFFDRELQFAFFPRQDDVWLNNFYKKQGERDSRQKDLRLNFFNSKALNMSAQLMLKFAEFNDTNGVFCDFGAGTGWLAKAINERSSSKTYAIDFSIDAMDHLKEFEECFELKNLDEFYSLAMPNFDFLGCVDTFEHLNDPVSVLKKLYEKANVGALVFLSVPNFDSYFSKIHFGAHPYYAFPPHLNYFTKASFAALAETAGFEVVKQEVVRLPWEVEYVSRPFDRKNAPISGWKLWDVLNNGEDGERLFMLLKK